MKTKKKILNFDEKTDKQELLHKIVKLSRIENFIKVNYIDNPVHNHTYVQLVEKPGEIGAISLEKREDYVELSTFYHSTKLSKESVKTLNTEFNIDFREMIFNTIINETAQSISKYALNRIKEHAEENYIMTYNRKDRFLTKVYEISSFLFNNGPYIKKYKVKNEKEILYLIQRELNKILSDTKTSGERFVICNLAVANYLQDKIDFPINADNQIEIRDGGKIYLVTEYANIKFFVNPLMGWDDLSIYIGYRSIVETPGISAFFLKNGTDIQEIEEADLLSTKIILQLRYALANIGKSRCLSYRKIVLNKLPK